MSDSWKMSDLVVQTTLHVTIYRQKKKKKWKTHTRPQWSTFDFYFFFFLHCFQSGLPSNSSAHHYYYHFHAEQLYIDEQMRRRRWRRWWWVRSRRRLCRCSFWIWMKRCSRTKIHMIHVNVTNFFFFSFFFFHLANKFCSSTVFRVRVPNPCQWVLKSSKCGRSVWPHIAHLVQFTQCTQFHKSVHCQWIIVTRSSLVCTYICRRWEFRDMFGFGVCVFSLLLLVRLFRFRWFDELSFAAHFSS